MFLLLVQTEKISFETNFNLMKNRSFTSIPTPNPNPKLLDQSLQLSDLDVSSRVLIKNEEEKRKLVPHIKKCVTFQKNQIEEMGFHPKKRVQFALFDETITEEFEHSFYLDESISSINNEASFLQAERDEFNVGEEFKISPISEKVTLLDRNF